MLPFVSRFTARLAVPRVLISWQLLHAPGHGVSVRRYTSAALHYADRRGAGVSSSLAALILFRVSFWRWRPPVIFVPAFSLLNAPAFIKSCSSFFFTSMSPVLPAFSGLALSTCHPHVTDRCICGLGAWQSVTHGSRVPVVSTDVHFEPFPLSLCAHRFYHYRS